jgi:uncharacterized protein (TIGR03437 family)
MKRHLPRTLTLMSRSTLLVLCFTLLTAHGFGAPPARILATIDDANRVYLTGHIHPKAQVQYDQGRASAALKLTNVTVYLKPSADQQTALDQFLEDVQNPASPNYHHWLTPEEYGSRFGVGDADLARIHSWLQSHGLTVTSTARGRNFITFDGAASDVQQAFRVELHNYAVDGETHFANSSDPSIPAALQPVVRGIHGLNDFRLTPRFKSRVAPSPLYNSSSGYNFIAPDDFATIYDVKPLYDSGIDGTGQKIVIVGQTNIDVTDLEQFRSYFNLPGQDPQLVLVPTSRDPGLRTRSGDLEEADLDLEWSSALARNASIIYVYSTDVAVSWQYAIDQNLAPVMSSSYGSCEASNGPAEATALRSLAQQAVSQGMTWFAASGDSGAADCNGDGSGNNSVLSVDLPAAIPEVTGVGGTEFNEGAGTYWNSTATANHASALSYVPETAWNDSAADGTPSASGGGASMFFGKPTWQTGSGVPSDGARDVPDVSFSASADHDAYVIYTSGSLAGVGGTSVAAPIMAGIGALLNQQVMKNGAQTAAGLGSVNPKLYALAQSNPGTFHDITTGNNMVSTLCRRGVCSGTPIGYSAGVGYDQVTGLGSVDVSNLLTAWTGSAPSKIAPSMAVAASSANLTAGASTVLTATVTGSNGTTPTGTVTFLLGTTVLGSAQLSGSGGTSTASVTVAATLLASGLNTITAQYTSDNATFSNAAASVTVTVSSGSATIAIDGIADGASFQHRYAPGEVLSVFGSGLASATQAASSVPLPASMAGVSATINGASAPLYLVSSTQINLQVPYGTAVNSTATLVIQNNGQSASYTFPVAATAPAIFVDGNGAPVPNTSAKAGDVITLFVTGAGAVTPSIATGAAPPSGTAVANLPRPQSQVSVTVGGIPVTIQFEGIPSGLVGVLQINYQVPSGLTAGIHPVVVTIGGASSAEANLTIGQ